MTNDSPATAAPGDREPSAAVLELLERLARDQGKPQLTLETAEESPLFWLSKTEAAAAATGGPFFVWLDNCTPYNVDVDIRWGQLGVGGTQQTGGTVWSSQVAPFALGGANGCDTVYAYIMAIYIQGQHVADTGVVQRQPGTECTHDHAVR